MVLVAAETAERPPQSRIGESFSRAKARDKWGMAAWYHGHLGDHRVRAAEAPVLAQNSH
jgi:hypothetical protein